MYKKVYKIFNSNLFFLYLIVFLFWSTTVSADSQYFFYILALNDWWLNLFFVVCIIFFNTHIFYIGNYIKCLCIFLMKQLVKQTFSVFFIKSLIPALMVGTISIHPFLFYFVILFIGNIFYFDKCWSFIKINFISYYFLIRVGFLTLFLGGVWGLQSITWGYIWANDKIEWLLFFLLISVLSYFHKIFKKYFIFILNFFLIFLNYLIFLRVSLLGSRHSFLASYSSKLYIYCLIATSCFWLNCLYSINFFKIKIPNRFYVIWWTFIIIDFFLISGVVLKLSFMFFFFYFIVYSFYFKKKSIHFFLFAFLCVWFSFFNTFFVILKNVFSKLNALIIYSDQIFTHISLIKLNSNKVKLLEFVNFNSFSEFSKYPFFSSNFIVSKFNNLHLLLIFIFLFFIKMVEFRLLHKKKTHF